MIISSKKSNRWIINSKVWEFEICTILASSEIVGPPISTLMIADVVVSISSMGKTPGLKMSVNFGAVDC